MFGEWILAALRHANLKQSELSRLLTERLGRSVDRSAVNKLTKDEQILKADEMLIISELTGFPLPGRNEPARFASASGKDGIDIPALTEMFSASLAELSPAVSVGMARNLAEALVEEARNPVNPTEDVPVLDQRRIAAEAIARLVARSPQK